MKPVYLCFFSGVVQTRINLSLVVSIERQAFPGDRTAFLFRLTDGSHHSVYLEAQEAEHVDAVLGGLDADK